MRKISATAAAVLCAAALLSSPARATSLSIVLDIQGQGLTVVDAGVGLQGLGSGTASLSLNVKGPVMAALLYWNGRDNPCPQDGGGVCVIPSQPYKDQVLRFEDVLVTGTIIGAEAQATSNHIGYLADVTSIVQAKGTGPQGFAIEDGDLDSNLFKLHGAGLLVIYSDPAVSATRRLIVYDGLDFAQGDASGDNQGTAAITIDHGAAAYASRATLRLFVGGGTARPDLLEIGGNESLLNTFRASDGAAWDSSALVIDLATGVSTTTVQVVSPTTVSHPDALSWQLAALYLPLDGVPIDTGCGAGYWKTHTAAWPPTGYSPGQSAQSAFSAAAGYPPLGTKSLVDTLQAKGGTGTRGAAQILLRSGVAALLSAAHPTVVYPSTVAQVIAGVNNALASNDRDTMLRLATELDNDTQIGCPLN